MTAAELWSEFLAKSGRPDGEYEAWAFGDAPDLLAALVVSGEKTATASACPLYAVDREPLPRAGEYSVILDSQDNAVCVIQTKKVSIVPFCKVSAEHAKKEGEGDKSLAYWRSVHEKLFTQWLNEVGLQFSPDMDVVCEEFEVVYQLEKSKRNM